MTKNKSYKYSLLVIVFLIGLLSPSFTLAASRVFYDGFESGNTNLWSQDGTRNKCTVVGTSLDGKAPLSGSKQAECNWNGVVAWNASDSFSNLMLSSWPVGSEQLVRVRVRYGSDVDEKDGNKALRLYNSNYSFIVEGTAGAFKAHWELVNGSSAPLHWGSKDLTDGNWHTLEIYEGPTGGKFWIDNELVYTRSGKANGPWSPLYIMSNWSSNPGWEHDANNHVYWDDIEIFTDSSGGTAISSGSLSNGDVASSGSNSMITPTPTPTPTPVSPTSSTSTGTPNVSGVSGILDHGSAITIVGSNFGIKSQAAPVVWDDATGSSLSQKWDGWWPNAGTASYQLMYSTPIRGVNPPHNNDNKYITGAHGDNAGSNAGYNVAMWKNITKSNGQILYWSWYSRVDPAWVFNTGSPADNNFKTFGYSVAGSIYELPNNWYTAMASESWTSANVTPCYGINDDGPSLQNPDVGGHNFWWNCASNNSYNLAKNWVKTEMEIKISNGSDGYIKEWENGVLMVDYKGPTDKYTGTARSVGVGGYTRGYGNANQRRYFDDVYFDTTKSRVILGNASTYNNSSVREIQIPSSWNSSSVSVKVNLGKFTSGQTAYLYIMDENGNVNYSGYPVTIGSSGTVTPMPAPVPPPPPAPTLTFTVSPSSLASGSSTILSWSSTNVTSCTAGGGWSGSKSTIGTQSVYPTSSTTYSLSCTGSGEAISKSVSVSVSSPSISTTTPTTPPTVYSQTISSFKLINADTDSVIKTLENGETINLATVVTKNLNIEAVTNPVTVGSVQFGYDSNANSQVENYYPYAAFDDDGGANFSAWTPTLGNHILTATPFTGVGTSGTKGTSKSISFTVINQVVSASTTATATTTPTTSNKFLIGDTVKVIVSWLNVRSNAGGGFSGYQRLNARGKVVDGPVKKSGYTWWKINFDSRTDGWVVENYLEKVIDTTASVDQEEIKLRITGLQAQVAQLIEALKILLENRQ